MSGSTAVSTESDFLAPYLWHEEMIKTKISMWTIGPKFSYMPGIEILIIIVVVVYIRVCK